MEITEKVAYLKGLAEGMELDTEKKEGKLLAAIIDVLDDIALEIADMKADQEELYDGLDAVSDDLEDVEDAVFGEDDEDEEDVYEYEEPEEDEDCYATTCPTCEETIYFDESVLEDGEVICPNCGEKLEFDLNGLEDEDRAPGRGIIPICEHRSPVHSTGLLFAFSAAHSTVTANRQQVPPPSTVSTVSDRDVLFRAAAVPECTAHSAGSIRSGRRRPSSSPQHLRADAFGITHLIEAPGLENLGKKALRVPVFPVLGVQVAAARPELRRSGQAGRSPAHTGRLSLCNPCLFLLNLSVILSGGFLRNTDPAGKVRGQEGLLGLPHPGVQAERRGQGLPPADRCTAAWRGSGTRVRPPAVPRCRSTRQKRRNRRHRAGAGRVRLQLLDDKGLRPIQVILCQDLPVHGIAQQVRQGLHGEAVLVRHIDPGSLRAMPL